ncbi:C40 family peptidase [Niabella terrae]
MKGVRLGGCLFLLCLLACGTRQQHLVQETISRARTIVRSGDLIVRSGRDEVSQTARDFNRVEKIYSHCGVVQVEQDSVFVYHAMGGRENPSRALMRQDLQTFCSPEQGRGFAIYRYPLTPRQSLRLSGLVQESYRQRLLFDWHFNFETDAEMYCSEFVFKCLNRALAGQLQQVVDRQVPPVYISIDDLYLLPGMIQLIELKY